MSENFKNPPCLILGYSRLEGTLRVADVALKNGCKKIYLSLDGPKDQRMFATQEQIEAKFRNLCQERNSEYEIRRLPENLGLKKAVISGIDWFFQNESEGFIFEDDLDISDYFFEYVSYVGNKFKSESNILLISGNQFEKNLNETNPVLSAYPLIWGWYTNIEKWNVIKRLISGEKLLQRRKLPLSVNMFWKFGALKSRLGISDSWAVPFAEGFRFQGYRCIVPSVNLVSNVGTDSFAVHTKALEIENSFPIDEEGAKNLLSNKSHWTYSDQDPRYLEKYVYRIRTKHAFLWMKLIYLYAQQALVKKSLDGNQNSSKQKF